MINKTIWTIWLNENKEIPGLVQKCVASQKIDGYEHKIITLENYYKGSKYVNDCIEAKRWVKASDWLRMWYLYTEGGIYLDADMEVLEGKNFDQFLDCEMFIGKEDCGHWATGCVGSVKSNPLLKRYLDRVSDNFLGSGDLTYDPGVRCFSDVIWLAARNGTLSGFTELAPDYFYPYNADKRTTNITKNTITFHHYLSSWVDTKLPLVSFLIPTLGREEGLKKCLASIEALRYPKELKEIIVLEGEGTVPEKVADGYKKSHGSLIVYGANDMEFTPFSLINAVEASKKHGLVAFNSGELYQDQGNICEHFLIRKDMVEKLGEIFSTKFNHVGCDNLLWAKAMKLDEAVRCEEAVIVHNHFVRGAEMDDIYKKGWGKVKEDRAILADELARL